jgi:hypothetical protein
MYATCLAPAGQNSPCTVDEEIKAKPGHTFFTENPGIATQSMTMVWPRLNKGKWKFQARLEGDGSSFVGYRTFVVQIFDRE